MSKATPLPAHDLAPAPHADSKRGRTAPVRRKPRNPAHPATTPELIARIWDTLNWGRTLQLAFIIAVTGITIASMLTGLELLAHAMTGTTAAWSAAATIITGTVSYRAALRQRR